MKHKFLVIIIFLIMINILCFYINSVNANYELQVESITKISASSSGITGDAISGGDDFLSAGQSSTGNIGINYTTLQDNSISIFKTIVIIGMVISVIFAGILGIKFMIGSAEEKAEVKDALVPFVIGCVVVFGAFGIWSIFVNILNNF